MVNTGQCWTPGSDEEIVDLMLLTGVLVVVVVCFEQTVMIHKSVLEERSGGGLCARHTQFWNVHTFRNSVAFSAWSNVKRPPFRFGNVLDGLRELIFLSLQFEAKGTTLKLQTSAAGGNQTGCCPSQCGREQLPSLLVASIF